jgi:hypothetical protein
LKRRCIDDDYYFYNSSTFAFDKRKFRISFVLKPKPISKDTVVVKVSDVFGEKLFSKNVKITNFDELQSTSKD